MFGTESGSGVFSLLACDKFDSGAFRRLVEGGGIYVCPREGEKSGRDAAVEMNLFIEDRIESCTKSDLLLAQ